MATMTDEEVETFDFHAGDTEGGDQYTLDGEGGQEVNIVIAEVKPDGRIYGIAVERHGTWCAPLGCIESLRPIERGAEAHIIFNTRGYHRVELVITPWRLKRVRGDVHTNLFG